MAGPGVWIEVPWDTCKVTPTLEHTKEKIFQIGKIFSPTPWPRISIEKMVHPAEEHAELGGHGQICRWKYLTYVYQQPSFCCRHHVKKRVECKLKAY